LSPHFLLTSAGPLFSMVYGKKKVEMGQHAGGEGQCRALGAHWH